MLGASVRSGTLNWRQVSEQHHFLIKIMSGLIRVDAVIAGTGRVPSTLPLIRLSLPLPWHCLIASNHRKHFFPFWTNVDSLGMNKEEREGTSLYSLFILCQ